LIQLHKQLEAGQVFGSPLFLSTRINDELQAVLTPASPR
jgi:hypothetical protein